MKIDIKQKVSNSRFCTSLPEYYEAEINSIIIYLKDILDIFVADKNTKLLCCYSYDIKSNIIKSLYTSSRYVVLDFHLIDYYIDFIYAFWNRKVFCKKYVYKYLSEIYYRMGCNFESVFLDNTYRKSEYVNMRGDKLRNLKISTLSIMFVLLHEIIHIKPEIAHKGGFTNLFKNQMDSELKKMNLMICGDEKVLIEESYCDFTSFFLLYTMTTARVTDHFGVDQEQLYRICLLTIVSMEFYDLLEKICIGKEDILLSGEFYNRFLIVGIFAYGFGIGRIGIYKEIMQSCEEFLKNIRDILDDLTDLVLEFRKKEDVQNLIENKIKKEVELQKNVWINVI